jgi:hypothetical protein
MFNNKRAYQSANAKTLYNTKLTPKFKKDILNSPYNIIETAKKNNKIIYLLRQ